MRELIAEINEIDWGDLPPLTECPDHNNLQDELFDRVELGNIQRFCTRCDEPIGIAHCDNRTCEEVAHDLLEMPDYGGTHHVAAFCEKHWSEQMADTKWGWFSPPKVPVTRFTADDRYECEQHGAVWGFEGYRPNCEVCEDAVIERRRGETPCGDCKHVRFMEDGPDMEFNPYCNIVDHRKYLVERPAVARCDNYEEDACL